MKNFKIVLILAVLINTSLIALILLSLNILPPVVPLFYGLPVSNAQLISAKGLVIPSLVSISAGLTNFLIIKITNDEFLGKILSGLTISTVILSAITTINIFTLVGKV